MQYILTEAELHHLKHAADERLITKDQTILDLCQRVADNEPVTVEWLGEGEPTPWGCVRSRKNWHCDHCPVKEICPYDNKSYSK